jgi:hypothetical protein
MLTLSGFSKEITHQQCPACIADNTIPGIAFHAEGVCSA